MAFYAQQLAVGLLKGAAGHVGARIIDQIFPPAVPTYFDEVYQEISKVVKQVIEQNTIDEVDGSVEGLKNWVNDIYLPQKASRTNEGTTELTKEAKLYLHGLLKEPELALSLQIGKLQQDSFAELGLGVFMIAAGIHLVLLQELAFVDPLVSDPSESAFSKTSIVRIAKRYADHAEMTYSSIESKRLNLVSGIHHHNKQDPSFFDMWDHTLVWRDDYTGEEKTYQDQTHHRKRPHKSTEEKAAKERGDHIIHVKRTLNWDCQNVIGTVKNWRQLIQTPLADLSRPVEGNADCKPM